MKVETPLRSVWLPPALGRAPRQVGGAHDLGTQHETRNMLGFTNKMRPDGGLFSKQPCGGYDRIGRRR